MRTFSWIGKEAMIGRHERVPLRLLRCGAALWPGDAGSGNLVLKGHSQIRAWLQGVVGAFGLSRRGSGSRFVAPRRRHPVIIWQAIEAWPRTWTTWKRVRSMQ